MLPQPAFATIFTVTNTNDSGAGSFRDTVTNANAGTSPEIIFSGTSSLNNQTITLGSAVTFTKSTRLNSSFLLTGGVPDTITLTGSPLNLNFTGGTGTLTIVGNAIINSNITQAGGQSDALSLNADTANGRSSVVTLGGTNNFSGGLAIGQDVTVQVASGNSLGGNYVGFFGSNGVIKTTAAITMTQNLVLGFGYGGTFNTNGFDSTISGNFNGDSVLTKTGTGTLTFSGSGSTNTGGITINAGLVVADSAGAIGTGTITLNGGAFLVTSTVSLANTVTFGASGGTINTNGNNITISSNIGGTGALVKSGTGSLILSGNNNYSGGTTIAGGTLSLQSNNAAGTGTITTTGSVIDYADGITVSNAISIHSNTTELQVLTGTATQAGQITQDSSSRPLTKSGNGKLIMTADNSYTNITTITGGILQLGNGGTTGSITSNVNGTSSGKIVFDRSDNYVFTQTITGSVSLEQTGSGKLTLNANDTYSGTTTVSAGTLEVGDSSHSSVNLGSGTNTLSVLNGARLSGYGTAHVTSLTNSGTVAPGDSNSGTLNIDGNYTQQSNGSLAIQITPMGASQLAVTGVANLAGSLSFAFANGLYAPATYTILSASSITGTLTTTATSFVDTAGKRYEVSAPVYTSNAITINLHEFVPAATTPTGGNVVGTSANSVIASSNTASSTIFDHMGDVHDGTVGQSSEMSLASFTEKTITLPGYGVNLNGIAKALPAAMKQNGGWFKAMGNLSSIGSTDGVSGYHSSSAGFMFGLDTEISKDTTVGAAGGYEHTAASVFNTNDTGATINTMRFALYGGHKLGDGYAIDAHTGYGLHMIDTKRFDTTANNFAQGSHDAHELSAGAQMSKKMHADGYTITPKAGLNYTYLYENGYSETDAGANNLTTQGKGTNSLRLHTGVSVSKPVKTQNGLAFTPEALLKYSYEALDVAQSVNAVYGGNAVNISGVKPTRSAVSAGIGVSAKLADELDGFANIDTTLPLGNVFSNSIEGGVRYSF